MPKNQVKDLITDQEIAFAHLVLSGTMTDRHAAEAVGLNPDTAAYTKAKPRVRAYMLEHRAAASEQLVQQETDLSRRAVEELRRQNLGREQVLVRLWEIANLSPEMTRNSASAQIKALSMIIAIEGLIPDRRSVSTQNKSAAPPVHPQIDTAGCPPRRAVEPAMGLREQQAKATVPQPSPDLVRDEAGPSVPDPPPGTAADAPSVLDPAVGLAFDSSEPILAAHPVSPSEMTPSSPYARVPDFAPANGAPSSIEKKPFTWRLRL
jgi:hypothetical protein